MIIGNCNVYYFWEHTMLVKLRTSLDITTFLFNANVKAIYTSGSLGISSVTL
jgi:hypothetical protein